MMPPPPAPPSLTLSPLYTLFFLYLEPLGITLGGLQALLFPLAYLSNFTPISPSLTATGIQTEFIVPLTQLAACEIFMGGVEFFVLRMARHDLRVWRLVLGLMLLGDFMHTLGLWWVVGMDVFRPWAWRVEEYGNYGMLGVAVVLRVAFLLGLGARIEGDGGRQGKGGKGA